MLKQTEEPIRKVYFVLGCRSGYFSQHGCEVRAERDFIACSQLRIIDAQPPQGNTGHQDELQARGGRPTHFLTVCDCMCVRVEIIGVWGLLVRGV